MHKVMTKNKATQQGESFPSSSPSVFSPTSENPTDTQAAEISFFDVKALYECAYEAVNAGREDYKAKEMMAQAIKMDMAYRCQLSRKSCYKKPSRLNDFRITSKSA